MKTERVFSKAPWEERVAYCRAVRKGSFIAVSGTTAIGDDGKVFEPGNAYAQTKRCLEIIDVALQQVGSSLRDVVRTRMFVTEIAQFAEYGRAHAEVFISFPPATSMLEIKGLISPDMLVEIEADAICLTPAETPMEMKNCQRCQTSLPKDANAFICSHKCTFCTECSKSLSGVCPNCRGELYARR